MKNQALIFLVALVGVLGCAGKTLPPDTSGVKYVNRGNPGARLNFDGSLFVPGKMNVLYFYADW